MQRVFPLCLNNMVDLMATSARVLAPADVQRMLLHVGDWRTAERNTCIILLSFHAGLRACEIAGLEWPMVASAHGRICQQIAVSGTIAKNGRQRTIPLHPILVLALRQLHRTDGKPNSGPVIRSLRGGHMTPRSIVNWFTKLYWELGYEGCSSHSGRRTFITRSARLIFKAGGSLKDIQELAGHSCLTTTERYIEGDREAQRKLIRLL
jgi:integrase/recombinase XerD